MTPLDLTPIKDREAKASKGPWVTGSWTGRCKLKHKHDRISCTYEYSFIQNEYFGKYVSGPTPVEIIGGDDNGPILSEENSKFIAHSRTDIPALIAEVERFRAILGEKA